MSDIDQLTIVLQILFFKEEFNLFINKKLVGHLLTCTHIHSHATINTHMTFDSSSSSSKFDY